MPKLIRHDTKDEFELADGATVLGRSPNCDIQIAGRAISRTHCKIEGPAGGWVVTDCGSKLGTFVNGKRIQQHRLEQHDELKVGPALFVFDEDVPPSPARRRAESEAARDELPAMPPKRRSVMALVPALIGAVAAVAVIGGLLSLALTTRATPTRVVRRAADLLRRRDAKALWGLVSKDRTRAITFEEFQEQVALVPDEVLGALRTLEVGEERRAPVGVVVPVAVELGGTRIADEVVLYREDGDWKIHSVPVERVRIPGR